MHRAALLFTAALTAAPACRSPARAAAEGEIPETRPVVTVDGARWVVEHEAEVPPLRPWVRLLGRLRWGDRFAAPRTETCFVRAGDGSIVAIRRAADLVAFARLLTTPEAALGYVKFLRLFALPGDEVPGLVEGSPERGGILTSLMEEALTQEGLDPTPAIRAVPGGFGLVRLVVVRRATGTPALVRIRERLGTDGTHAAEVLATLREGGNVNDWIWQAC